MKRLVVTADDAGLDPGMTEGVIRAHREGIVTACSIVANGRAFDDAVVRLREVPSLEVGVHLTLVEERALTTGEPMPRNYVRFLLAPRRFDVEKELRAQMERVLSSGLRITHVNGHQHLHMLPSIYEIVVQLAAEYRIAYIRRVDDRGGRVPPMRRAAVAMLSTFGRRTSGTRRTIGVAEAGHLTVDTIVRLLDVVEGDMELVTHPGVGVTGYDDWNYAWDAETAALCDPRLRAALVAREITLAAPSALAAPQPR